MPPGDGAALDAASADLNAVSFAGRTPVAPAFDTALLLAATSQFVGCLEVAQEGFPRLHRDDRAAVLPDAIEQRCEQPAALRRSSSSSQTRAKSASSSSALSSRGSNGA